ncbi:MAG: dTMP kinase [Desulfotomaculaceae bacterium]|nr:dTMP kinase [Desulfotomaculaceae bacterium]
MNGKFLVFEGIDGSGKTTQLKLLGDKLSTRGYPVLYTREPGGTRIGETVRELLLDPQHSELVPVAEALLYAAARAQHVAQVIMPALQAGNIVLCDRFLDSSLAYQGFGRGLDVGQLERLNEAATAGLKPDLVLLLDFLCDTGMNRIARAGRRVDRIEQEDRAFYSKVRSGYLTLAGRDPSRYRVIDANRAIEQIHYDIIGVVEEILE